MRRRKLPDANRLNELLRYDPETGNLFWKEGRSNVRAGDIAGIRTESGIKVSIDGTLYLAHRVIWKMVKGDEPPDILDHRNLLNHDNIWTNIRAADPTSNNANVKARKHNETGVKGVYRSHSVIERYHAMITVRSKRIYLGTFKTKDEASTAYQAAAISHFGEFARW